MRTRLYSCRRAGLSPTPLSAVTYRRGKKEREGSPGVPIVRGRRHNGAPVGRGLQSSRGPARRYIFVFVPETSRARHKRALLALIFSRCVFRRAPVRARARVSGESGGGAARAALRLMLLCLWKDSERVSARESAGFWQIRAAPFLKSESANAPRGR